jgi:hypothetical protein
MLQSKEVVRYGGAKSMGSCVYDGCWFVKWKGSFNSAGGEPDPPELKLAAAVSVDERFFEYLFHW